jgi:hypothetical protein
MFMSVFMDIKMVGQDIDRDAGTERVTARNTITDTDGDADRDRITNSRTHGHGQRS